MEDLCTVDQLLQCVGFLLVYQIDCVCLMEPLSHWGNPSCSLNSTDLRQKQYEAPFLCVRFLACASTASVFVRVAMWSADLCCFHGDWFPSRVRGLNHRQCTLLPRDLTFHFSISLSSTAAACFFIFLFPADDRKHVKCEIRKSVCK